MKKVFSFCLYGQNKKYWGGLLENISFIQSELPDWWIYVWIGEHIPDKVINEIAQRPKVKLIPTYHNGCINMSYRFFSIDDPDVELMCVRDADSRVNARDKACIEDFMNSEKLFHIVRDHPYHEFHPIMGGMWGVKKQFLREPIQDAFHRWEKTNSSAKFWNDMDFLKSYFYPRCLDVSMIHDDSESLENRALHTEFRIPLNELKRDFIGQAYEVNEDGIFYPAWDRVRNLFGHKLYFCMDLHISVIADFKAANPDIHVIDWCLSGHSWVMNRHHYYPDIINPETWRNMNMDMITQFQQRYDSFLSQFDGFIVGYASSFAMIYEKYNKPILMINAVRYDIPFCWSNDLYMLSQWNDCLHRLRNRGLLTLVSNNKADQFYTELGSGLCSEFIPSLCLYTNTQYKPSKDTFLCVNGDISHPLITHKKDIPHPHSWSDLTSFRGIIHFPYEVSLMSIFEQYTSGCPLFFPSKAFWKANPKIQSISAYWDTRLPNQYSQLSTTDAWIDLADMYHTFQSPNTHYYDSYDHLLHLVEVFEYKDDSELRKTFIENTKRKWDSLKVFL